MRGWPTAKDIKDCTRGRKTGTWLHTPSDHAVNERLFTLEKVLMDHSSPVVAVEDQLVLKEVEVCSLIASLHSAQHALMMAT